MAKNKVVRLTELGVKNSHITGALLLSAVGFPSLNLTGNDHTYETKATKKSPPKQVVIKGATQRQLQDVFAKFGDLGGQLEEVEQVKREAKTDG